MPSMRNTAPVLLSLAVLLAGPARADDRAVLLWAFGNNAYSPESGPVVAPNGTLFGTVPYGGPACGQTLGCGAVYALTVGAGPAPHFRILHQFTGKADGASPTAKPTVSRAGTVFGYTAAGSPGTVFQLTPTAKAGQSYMFSTIYTFTGGADGALIYFGPPLVLRGGDLFGISNVSGADCGSTGCTALFRLTPPARGGGAWKETTVYTFPPGLRALNLARDGTYGLFAVTANQGNAGGGSVVRLAPPAHGAGQWSATTVATLTGKGRYNTPYSLVAAPNGMLYLIYGIGIYQLSPPSAGGTAWSVTEIASPKAGGYGVNTVEIGGHGGLIASSYGDQDFFGGAVFGLTPPSGGGTGWTTTLLANFNSGSVPSSNPIDAIAGPGDAVYGAANDTYDNGTLFALYPPQ